MAKQIFGGIATVIEMNIALVGLVPANADYLMQLQVVGDDNAHLADYANRLTEAFAAGTTDSALATTVLDHLLGEDPANTVALHDQLAALLAANAGNHGVVVYQLVDLLSNLEADAHYGAAAKVLNVETLNGYRYSSDPSATTPAPANNQTHSGGGHSYLLTSGTDKLVASAADDTILGTETTLTVGDVLEGNGGHDTLRYVSSGPAVIHTQGFTTHGIQTLTVTSDAIDSTTVDTSGMAGLMALVNDNSSTDVRFDQVATLTTLRLQNVSCGDTQLVFQAGAADHNDDTLALALSNNKTIAGGSIGGVRADGVETFAITTSGGASDIAALSSTTLHSVTIAGDQALTLHQLNFFNPGGSNLVDASALTGRLDLSLGSGSTRGNTTVVNGGSGTDTLHFSGNLADYRLLKGATGTTVHDQRVALLPVGDVQVSAVERLAFHDQGLALDMAADQAGGKALLLLATALGTASLKDGGEVARLLAYFDNGGSMLDGASQLLANGRVAALAGGSGNAALVGWVYHNLYGNTPDASTLAALTAPLDSHSQTPAQWLAAIAQSGLAQQQVHLAGYADSGLAYAL